MDTTDFRAVRWVLEDKDFAGHDPDDARPDPPKQLVEEATWRIAGSLGMDCGALTPLRLTCLNNFCNGEGDVWCLPDTDQGCGLSPYFSGPGKYPHPSSPIFIYPNCPGRQPYWDSTDNGVVASFLHKMMHACGIAHGQPYNPITGLPGPSDPVPWECNEFYACCMESVLTGGNGSGCYSRLPPF